MRKDFKYLCHVTVEEWYKIDGFVQERCNSIANVLELRLSCSNPSICKYVFIFPLENFARKRLISPLPAQSPLRSLWWYQCWLSVWEAHWNSHHHSETADPFLLILKQSNTFLFVFIKKINLAWLLKSIKKCMHLLNNGTPSGNFSTMIDPLSANIQWHIPHNLWCDTIPADALAPGIARSSADTIFTKWNGDAKQPLTFQCGGMIW